MKNLKDNITVICGIILTICGILTGLVQSGITLPEWIQPTCVTVGAICGGIIAYLTGKNSDGTTKKPEQLTSKNDIPNTIEPQIESIAGNIK